MNIEHYSHGVKINGPAVVIRKSAAIKLFGYNPETQKVENGTCPKCGKSGFNCCSYSDSVQLSAESKSLNQNENHPASSAENTSTQKIPANKTEELTDEEKQEVEDLKKRDREVRQHEQAHLAAAGHLASGGPSYSYESGPDGNKYAVGGEVNIKLDQGNSPEEKLQNAKQAERAANAPAEPSPQDKQIAAEARRMATEAHEEIKNEQTNKDESESSAISDRDKNQETTATINTPDSPLKRASDAYKDQSIQQPSSSYNSTSVSKTLKAVGYFGSLSVYA